MAMKLISFQPLMTPKVLIHAIELDLMQYLQMYIIERFRVDNFMAIQAWV
jgi:hypothetical protein